MEVIASALKKDSGKGRTIVEGSRSQCLRAERRFHDPVVAVAIIVVIGGKLYPRKQRNLNKDHLSGVSQT